MDFRNRKNQNDPKSTIIFLIIAVLFLLPEDISYTIIGLVVLLAPIGIILWLALRKKKGGSRQASGQIRQEKPVPAFDDCPRPFFCFHKDKGEHHVRRGQEIDPWDRPDIDISKYQRK